MNFIGKGSVAVVEINIILNPEIIGYVQICPAVIIQITGRNTVGKSGFEQTCFF